MPLDATIVVENDPSAWKSVVRSKSVSCVYLCGVPFESVVAAAARECLALGLAVFVVLDGVAAANAQSAASQREELKRLGVHFVEGLAL